ELGALVLDVDTHVLELLLEVADARLGGVELLLHVVVVLLKLVVLVELRLPFGFGVTATEQHRGDDDEGLLAHGADYNSALSRGIRTAGKDRTSPPSHPPSPCATPPCSRHEPFRLRP